MLTRIRPAAAVAALGALVLAGCGSPGAPAAAPPAAPETPTVAVVASTNVYGSIVSAVGGDRVRVTSIIDDPSADPHTFEAAPADAADVAEARLVVINGGHYDDFAERLVEAAGPGERTVVDVAALSGLEPVEETPAAGGAEEEHEHGDFNEHVWYSLPTVEKLAGQVATDLTAIDPAGADAYAAGAAAFTQQVQALREKAAGIKQRHPGARVAVTEPVPGYLIEEAGLIDATPPAYSEAIEEDVDPPAAVVAQTLDLFTGTPVTALILNAQTQTPTTDQVRQAAQTAGVPVVEVSETLPEGQRDYVAWMGGQIDALAAALDR